MFGNVNIDKMELKMKEYYSYRGYYCGLCKTIKTEYNNLCRLTLNYDMTFLIVLLSSLYEPQNKITNEKCMVHPVSKHLVIQNEITKYAASLNIMLSYYNLIDNWNDDKDFKSLSIAKLLEGHLKNISPELKEKEIKIKQLLNNLTLIEKQNVSDIDSASNEFGHIMEEIFVYKDDIWEKTLRKIGFFLGKYVYLIDAYDDMEKDLKNNSYNPFNLADEEDIDQYAANIITLNLSFLSEEIEKLPIEQDKGVIDNIIYSGMYKKIENIKNKKEQL
ncbi:MAG: hypothetical protein K0Q97_3071 [Bacillota bacterium]|jgi:hypothetical protein|nr:hypothetical protein [Bacillota bacterium]